MEKILTNLPIGLLLAYTGKLIVTTSTYSDSLIILGLCALSGVVSWAEQNKKVKNLDERLDKADEKLDQIQKEHSEVRAYVSSIKLNNTFSNNKIR